MKLTPRQAMALAIEEAKRGAGFVSPNPLVGCVILDSQGELIGSGYHARVGEGHAEVNALESVKNPALLDGAHVFVTLEPCAHFGRTPPCAKTLGETTISNVTYGLGDPNPLVSGKGAEMLRAAGKKVVQFSEMQDELENVAEIFLKNQRTSRPFVAIKIGSSLDGQIALKSGESQWITNEESRAHVQWIRGNYDAVLIGAKTYLKDDPKLNSRDPYFADRAAKVVLIDPDGETLSKLPVSNLLKVRPAENIFVVVRSSVKWPSSLSNVQKVAIESTDDEFSWDEILKRLFEVGIMSVLVEGGSHVISKLIEQNRVDRVYAFIAPKILGAKGSLSWTSGFEIHELNQAPILERVETKTFGSDILVTGRILQNRSRT